MSSRASKRRRTARARPVSLLRAQAREHRSHLKFHLIKGS